MTPHPCTNNNYHVCETTGCGGTYSADRFAGDCDANGCDYNPYRVGNTGFYGKGKTVDTSQKFTSVFTPEDDVVEEIKMYIAGRKANYQ